jgi:hypothetical protein
MAERISICIFPHPSGSPPFRPETGIGKSLRILLLDRPVIGQVWGAPHGRLSTPKPLRLKAETMSTNQSGGAAPQGKPSNRHHEREAPPVSNAMLAIIVVAIVAALVLGYLFLGKLIDISRQEDCMLAHNKNCAAVELPNR